MKKSALIFVLILLILINLSYSQTTTPSVDSLLNVMKTATNSELLMLYPRLHKALYEINDIDIHLKYNNEFAEAAKAAKDKKAEAKAYVLRVEALYNYRMPDSILLAESMKALDFMKDVPGAEVHYFYTASVVSDVYMLEGNYGKALELAEQFYNEAKKKKNSSGLLASLQTMGKAYQELELLDKAEISFRESIKVANERTDYGMKGESYSYLVDMLNEQKRYNDALEVSKEFEAYLLRIDAYNSEVKNLCFLNYLGYVASYTKLGQYELAWESLRKAEKFPIAGTSMGMYSVENEQFNLLFEEGSYAQAEQSLNKLHEILDNDASYFNAALHMKKARAELYFRWGKYDLSADAYKDYITCKDSVQRVEMATKLNTLRTQYEVDKLEMRHEEQKRTFYHTIFWFCVVFILLGIIIAIVIINSRKLRAKNRSLLNRIHEQDELKLRYEQMRNEQAKNNIDTENIQDKSLNELYFNLKELMKDPSVFTDPNINRKTIARRLGTNEKYVFDMIKEYYGTNVSDYINNLRINYARNLLTLPSDERTIKTIALESGFKSRSAFYLLFKEHYGMTPAEFRDLIATSEQ